LADIFDERAKKHRNIVMMMIELNTLFKIEAMKSFVDLVDSEESDFFVWTGSQPPF
jgi:hypothetical protein